MSTPTSTGYRDYIQVMSSRLNRAEEARRAARAAQAASSEIRQAESTAASGPNRYIVDLQGNRYGRPSSATPWSDSATPQIPSSLSSGAVSRSQPSSSPHKPSNANQHRFPIPAYLKASNAYNRMVTQQVQSDFSKISPVLLPTQWDEKKCCEVLEMSGDGLTVQFRGTGKNGAKDAAAVKADRHMPHQCGVYYFEIEILSKGQSGYIGIGFSGPEVSLTRLPGACFKFFTALRNSSVIRLLQAGRTILTDTTVMTATRSAHKAPAALSARHSLRRTLSGVVSIGRLAALSSPKMVFSLVSLPGAFLLPATLMLIGNWNRLLL